MPKTTRRACLSALLWMMLAGLLLPVLAPQEAVAAVVPEAYLPDASAPLTDDWRPPGVRLELSPWLALQTQTTPVSAEDPQAQATVSRTTASPHGNGVLPGHHGEADRREWFASWGGGAIGLVLATGVTAGIFMALGDGNEPGTVFGLGLLPYMFLPATMASLFNRAPWSANFLGGLAGTALLAIGTVAGFAVGLVLLVFALFAALVRLLNGSSNEWLSASFPYLFFGPIALGTGLGMLATSVGPAMGFGIWAKKHPRRDVTAQARLAPMVTVLRGDRRMGWRAEAVGGLRVQLSF